MSMIYVRESAKYLYHYTASAKAMKILGNGALRLGRFETTNDPREYMDWLFGAVSARRDRLPLLDTSDLSARLTRSIKKVARLACFCSDVPGLSGDHTQDILRRGFARPRMWAQYGASHTGFCLVFDKQRFVDQVRAHLPHAKVLSEAIAYQDRGSFPETFSGAFSVNVDQLDALGFDRYADRFLAKNYRQLLFEKLLDWRDEIEWRVVVHGLPEGDYLVPFGDALIGVMHGAATPERVSSRAMNLTRKMKVEHMGLCWNNHAPWYDFRRREWSLDDQDVLRRLRRRQLKGARKTVSAQPRDK